MAATTTPVPGEVYVDTYGQEWEQTASGSWVKVQADLTGSVPVDEFTAGIAAEVVARNAAIAAAIASQAEANQNEYETQSSTAVAIAAALASLTSEIVSFTGVAAGQVVELSHAGGLLTALFINGLFQSDGYSISGNVLTIPAGLVWDGADCWFQQLHV